MTDLPDNWIEIPLGSLTGKTAQINPASFPDEPFELYSVPAFANQQADLVQGSEIKSTKQHVEPDDVLLCKIVPHLNRVWVVPPRNNRRQIASGEWIVHRSKELDPHYLRYLLSAPDFRDLFLSTVSGVGGSLMRARPSAVKETNIPVAPLREQRRITAKLDCLSARSSRARMELDRIPTLIDRYKQAILAKAFSGELTADWREGRTPASVPAIRNAVFSERETQRALHGVRGKGANRSLHPSTSQLPDIPPGWAWFTFDECSWDLTVGHVGPMKDRYVESGVPFLRSFNVRPNRIDTANITFIDAAFDNELRKSRLREGTIVVVRTGEPGTAAVIPRELDGSNCSDLVICRPIPSLNAFFAAHYINSSFAKRMVRGAQVGVAQQHFNVGAMSQLAVPYPPTEEQVEILRRIEFAFSWIDNICTEHSRARHLLPKLDQAILAKAFRGELVPQDPNNEPASKLLERLALEAPVSKAGSGRKRTTASTAQG